jgi:hypothetical protein
LAIHRAVAQKGSGTFEIKAFAKWSRSCRFAFFRSTDQSEVFADDDFALTVIPEVRVWGQIENKMVVLVVEIGDEARVVAAVAIHISGYENSERDVSGSA